jgi:hypothetical protein
MERIEIPATVYWKTKTGKKFSNQEDCEKYEKLHDKWHKYKASELYREFENVEGQLCYAYWIESKEELDDVIWLTHHRLNSSTCNYVSRDDRELTPQWIVAYPDYNEYNAEMAIRTLEEVRDITEDTLKAAQETLSTIVKLLWEKV